MDSFEIGEVATLFCILCMQDEDFTYLNGEEVEVIGGLMMRTWSDKIERRSYKIQTKTGRRLIALPQELRKKKPPEYDGYDIVEWDDCIWQPETVKVM